LTIAAALFLGLRRRWAAEYSFFVAIPTILAGTFVQAVLLSRPRAGIQLDAAAFAIGFVVAAAVGALALALVLHLLYRARFRYFAYHVWCVAAAVAALATAGVL
jgi:undecaprenyl-diphosphatase